MCNYSKTEMDDLVFNFIYGCALRDAILQKAFKGERTWIGKVSKAQVYVKKYIDRILNGEFRKEDEAVRQAHEEAFLETAVNVCNAINGYGNKPYDAGTFSFGNAQKLINMTVKHVYAHTYSIHSVGFSSIREHFRYCHCPMDSIMLSRVWKTYRNIFGMNERETKLTTDFCKAWGCETFEADKNDKLLQPQRYISFQRAIKDIIQKSGCDIFPIEYDYIVWKN